MKTLKLARRNVFRNPRRSLATACAAALSAAGILLFGGFTASIQKMLETAIVRASGHIHIYKAGYFEFGEANPAGHSIEKYDDLVKLLRETPELKGKIRIITKVQEVYGIASNFRTDSSKIFSGLGVVPSEYTALGGWNPYKITIYKTEDSPGVSDTDLNSGIIGTGMARILGLCKALGVDGCPEKPLPQKTENKKPKTDFSYLMDGAEDPAPADPRPRIDLIAATAQGAPNVVDLYVNKALPIGIKTQDDSFIAMHIDKAQTLLYGRSEKKISGLIIQLEKTSQLAQAEKTIKKLLAENRPDLITLNYTTLQPAYGQAAAMLDTIFAFIALIMGMIVLFTVINTMSTSVVERTSEIGTLRALGLRRSNVIRMFVSEGLILGVAGATAGVLLAFSTAAAINALGFTWTPPTFARPVVFSVHILLNPALAPVCWCGI
ncbi:MAG: FtsX-like permease family protein, partial [Elusimicrobiaceae bacterium]